MRNRPASERIPLKDLELTILMALAEAPLHGYALLQRAATGSSGLVAPGPTSLYRTIANLVDEGLIEEAAPPAASTDDRRRYFRQTPFGRAVLRAELGRLAGVVRKARSLGITLDTERP